MKQLDIKEFVIVSDFDGTITLEDTNDLLFLTCGTAENEEIENDFRAGKKDDRETMKRHFGVARLTFEEYFYFLDTKVKVDTGFDSFLKFLHGQELPLFIVSGGYRIAIERVLGKEKLEGVQIFANDLQLDNGYLTPFYAMENHVCTEPIGPCGNCKKICIDTIRRKTGKKILYIGDGLTDRCVIHKTDLVFAKENLALAEHCRANSSPYISFTCLGEIVGYLSENSR